MTDSANYNLNESNIVTGEAYSGTTIDHDDDESIVEENHYLSDELIEEIVDRIIKIDLPTQMDEIRKQIRKPLVELSTRENAFPVDQFIALINEEKQCWNENRSSVNSNGEKLNDVDTQILSEYIDKALSALDDLVYYVNQRFDAFSLELTILTHRLVCIHLFGVSEDQYSTGNTGRESTSSDVNFDFTSEQEFMINLNIEKVKKQANEYLKILKDDWLNEVNALREGIENGTRIQEIIALEETAQQKVILKTSSKTLSRKKPTCFQLLCCCCICLCHTFHRRTYQSEPIDVDNDFGITKSVVINPISESKDQIAASRLDAEPEKQQIQSDNAHIKDSEEGTLENVVSLPASNNSQATLKNTTTNNSDSISSLSIQQAPSELHENDEFVGTPTVSSEPTSIDQLNVESTMEKKYVKPSKFFTGLRVSKKVGFFNASSSTILIIVCDDPNAMKVTKAGLGVSTSGFNISFERVIKAAKCELLVISRQCESIIRRTESSVRIHVLLKGINTVNDRSVNGYYFLRYNKELKRGSMYTIQEKAVNINSAITFVNEDFILQFL